MSEIVRHAIETKSKIKQELVLKQQDFLLNEVCNYCGFSNMYSETPQKPFQDETKFWFKGNIYIGKSRFGTTYHAWYRGDSSRDLVQKHLCINYILLPGRKPGTSTNVTIGMLNESQNLTNLAPLTEALMSKQPETENNGIE